jgi:predicted nuclease with TOPRIM domain
VEYSEFIEKITEIKESKDTALITPILAELTNDYEQMLAEKTTLEKDLNIKKEENESLRNANMQLFSKVASRKTELDDFNKGKDPTPKPETTTIDKLFNSRGEIF